MRTLPRLLVLLALVSCTQSQAPETSQPANSTEQKAALTIERSYGPRLLEIVEDGDRTSERYHETDSVLEVERMYVHGILDSVTEWDGYGNLWFQTSYSNGKRHGKHICYNPDGSVRYVQVYEMDSLVADTDYSK